MAFRYPERSDWEPLNWINWDLEGVMSVFQNITMPLAHSLAHIEEAGIQIDMEQLNRIDTQYRADVAELEMKWGDITGGINIASHKELKEWLYDELDLPILAVSRKTGAPSTGLPVLERLVHLHESVPILIELKKKKKAIRDFLGGSGNVRGILQWIEPDGRVHPNYRVDGTDSGRLSSYGPNGQNVSKNPDIRQMFCSRPGYSFIECDYSTLELRVAATIWNDRTMLKALREGDLHTLTACMMFDKEAQDIIKSERDAGKVTNFSVLYLTSPYSLSFRLDRTPEECEEYINGWFKLYNNIKRGIRETQKNALINGYTDSVFGRRRRLPQLANPNKSDPKWKKQAQHLYRVAANFAIQSTGSDVLSLSTIQLILDPEPAFRKLGAVPIASIHDAVFFEVPDANAIEAAQIIKTTMETVPQQILGTNWHLPADVKVGRYWGDGSIYHS